MERGLPKFWRLLSVFCAVTFFTSFAFGQTGKISGQVTDSESGEPLPGVNIVVEDTDLGAATDADGFYFIINLPPGEYSVRASMIGYAEITKTNVLVESNTTNTIDFELTPSAIQGEAITVEAERDVITMDRSASEVKSQREDIDQVATIKDITSFINQQVGVEGMQIRGGSADQTQFMMDGLTVVDNRQNQPLMMVNLSAIQELSIIKGGFNAEYGNVRSGLISVVTKTGSPDRYSGSLDLRYSGPRLKHSGTSIYNWENWYIRPYLDPDVAFVGTHDDNPDDGDGVSPWDQEMRNKYEQFQGWNSVVAGYNSDDDPLNNMTAEEARDRFLWRHAAEGSGELGQREMEYGHLPDYNIDASLSGPVPAIGQLLGNMTFFVSHRTNNDAFALPQNRDYFTEQNTQLKLTSRITESMKLTLDGIYGEVNSIANGSNNYYRSGFDPLNSAGGFNDHLYWIGSRVPYDLYRTVGGISFDHILSNKTFYNLDISYIHLQDLARGPASWRDTTTVRYFGSYPIDEVPYGYWFFGGHHRMADNQVYQGGGAGARNWSETNTINIKFDLTSQINRFHQIKTGFNYNYDDLDVHYEHIRMDLPVQNWKVKWQQFPSRLGAYIQDKMEFQGLIANIGIRLDYNEPNTEWYLVDPYSKFFRPAYRDSFTDVAPTEEAKGHLQVSPRIGISHPITATAKLYFNYGHFYSMPTSESMYAIDYGNPNEGINRLGNPSVNLPRTVAYELGFEQEIGGMYLIHLSGYYKDVTNQTAQVRYQNYDATVNYTTYANQNYEDIRGFELRMEKRYGRWFTGWLNYDYRVETAGYIGREVYFQDPRQQMLYGLRNPYQEKPLARPVARANVRFHTPEDFGPTVAGIKVLAGWQAGLLFNWKSGFYETWDPLETGELQDNIHWRGATYFDARIGKRARIGGINLNIFADIYNVFNSRYIAGQGFADGLDRRRYLESLKLPMYSEQQYQDAGYTAGDDRPGDRKSSDKPYINMPNRDFLTYLHPRYVEFGIRVDF